MRLKFRPVDSSFYDLFAEAANHLVVGSQLLSEMLSVGNSKAEIAQRMREAGMGDVPIVVGGIIPANDVNVLKQCGASAVYTPKDFQLNDIMTGIVRLVDAKAAELAEASIPVPPLRAREKVPL